MRYAKVNDELEEATYLAHRENSCTCPGCGSPVIAKICADRVDHWAHHNVDNCDTWYEPITDWHIKWQDKFPKENREVHIVKDGKRHISDVHINRFFIEFQNSVISAKDVEAREKFYGPGLVWVLNGNGPICNGWKVTYKCKLKTLLHLTPEQKHYLIGHWGFYWDGKERVWWMKSMEKDSLLSICEYVKTRFMGRVSYKIETDLNTQTVRKIFNKMRKLYIDTGEALIRYDGTKTFTHEEFVEKSIKHNWQAYDMKKQKEIEQDRQRRALETKILRRRMDNNKGLFLP